MDNNCIERKDLSSATLEECKQAYHDLAVDAVAKLVKAGMTNHKLSCELGEAKQQIVALKAEVEALKSDHAEFAQETIWDSMGEDI